MSTISALFERASRSSLVRLVFLRPYGPHLLTSAASVWFLAAMIVVLTMALCEALAWGYLGSLLGEGPLRAWTAGFVFLVVFAVIYQIDSSLVVLDRAFREHSRTLIDVAPDASVRPAPTSVVRQFLTFALRIAVLLSSLTVTAPYLAQLVFRKDIDQFIEGEATAAIDAGRQALAARFDKQIAAREVDYAAIREKHDLEVAGAGASGLPGAGPAAAALARTAEGIAAEVRTLKEEKTSELGQFDGLAIRWHENAGLIASRYGIALPRESILENSKALEALRQRPENRATELAIKVFLGLIFAGLLILKLFEPHSVRLYLSDLLQQEHVRYRKGFFDPFIKDATEHSPDGITEPQRFYEFLLNWRKGQAQRDRADELQRRLKEQDGRIASIQGMQGEANAERATFEARLPGLSKAADDAKTALNSLSGQIADAERTVEERRKVLQAHAQRREMFERGKNPLMSEAEYAKFLAITADYHNTATLLKMELDAAIQAIPNAASREALEAAVKRTEDDLTRGREFVRQKEEELKDLSAELRKARRRRIEIAEEGAMPPKMAA